MLEMPEPSAARFPPFAAAYAIDLVLYPIFFSFRHGGHGLQRMEKYCVSPVPLCL
jgi:hypothetical protein